MIPIIAQLIAALRALFADVFHIASGILHLAAWLVTVHPVAFFALAVCASGALLIADRASVRR